MHIAYTLENMHLAKVLLIKLRGIEVNGDDDPRIAQVYLSAAERSLRKAVLVFVHGFAAHMGCYDDMHPHFAQPGITVFAHDISELGRTALDGRHPSVDEYYEKRSCRHAPDPSTI
ncbi:hypothetical protein TRAPUB_10991 [Trametes pubescens]|uniref:Serine aminopeptidase S33 domain-containing protein n=1 Tax=Trametes pubescens TaxID=154538 RepID=A0A1M2VXZ7_TRAPU|nr:hypothetical protein TRAPUB_10991 [Trametes pubescens]